MIPVILSGGSGTRLWPLSREAYPKQFLPLAGEDTMLQATWQRVAALASGAPLVVANEEHLRTLAESSPSIVTPLNSAIGYEEAAKVAKEALKEKKTIRQTVIDRGLIGENLSLAELDKRLDVLAMAKVRDER